MPIEYYEEDYDDGPSEPSKQGILEDPDKDTVRVCFKRRGIVDRLSSQQVVIALRISSLTSFIVNSSSYRCVSWFQPTITWDTKKMTASEVRLGFCIARRPARCRRPVSCRSNTNLSNHNPLSIDHLTFDV